MIPKKIVIGFNKREDTFGGLLSFITTYQNEKKGTLKKEDGFHRWRDKNIPIQVLENIPTSGFIFNTRAGGNKCWTGREPKMRIFDPRGWEFEVGMDGIDHILAYSQIGAGKLIEGEFVYGFFGRDGLCLISTNSPEYKVTQKTLELLSIDDLKVGNSYKSANGKIYIYAGSGLVFDSFFQVAKPRRIYYEVLPKSSAKGITNYFEVRYNADLVSNLGAIDHQGYDGKLKTKSSYSEKIIAPFVDKIEFDLSKLNQIELTNNQIYDYIIPNTRNYYDTKLPLHNKKYYLIDNGDEYYIIECYGNISRNDIKCKDLRFRSKLVLKTGKMSEISWGKSYEMSCDFKFKKDEKIYEFDINKALKI